MINMQMSTHQNTDHVFCAYHHESQTTRDVYPLNWVLTSAGHAALVLADTIREVSAGEISRDNHPPYVDRWSG